jgi:hypothetical protein
LIRRHACIHGDIFDEELEAAGPLDFFFVEEELGLRAENGPLLRLDRRGRKRGLFRLVQRLVRGG